MKKANINIAFIVIFSLLILSAVSYFSSLGSLNNGGRVIIEPDEMDMVFNPYKAKSMDIPTKITIYFGTGWDNICFFDTTFYFISEDKIGGKVLQAGRFGYSTINHDAGQKNVPLVYSGNTKIDLAALPEGKYKISYANVISSISDRPSVGACASEINWNKALAESNARYSFETQPTQWFNYFKTAQQNEVIGEKTERFVVSSKDLGCNWWCQFTSWLRSLFG